MTEEAQVSEFDSMELDDILDINVDDIVPIRFENLPMGMYLFETDDVEVDKKDGKVVVRIKYKTVDVKSMVKLPEGKTEEDFIGKLFTQAFWLAAKEDIGRLRAAAEDLGLDSTGSVKDVITRFMGIPPFTGQIVHKDKNDGSGEVYVNLRVKAPPATQEG